MYVAQKDAISNKIVVVDRKYVIVLRIVCILENNNNTVSLNLQQSPLVDVYVVNCARLEVDLGEPPTRIPRHSPRIQSHSPNPPSHARSESHLETFVSFAVEGLARQTLISI